MLEDHAHHIDRKRGQWVLKIVLLYDVSKKRGALSGEAGSLAPEISPKKGRRNDAQHSQPKNGGVRLCGVRPRSMPNDAYIAVFDNYDKARYACCGLFDLSHSISKFTPAAYTWFRGKDACVDVQMGLQEVTSFCPKKM